MLGYIDSLENIKTSMQLLALIKEEYEFVSIENERSEIKVDLHIWDNYAYYEFTDNERYGVCPIENLWSFIKVKH